MQNEIEVMRVIRTPPMGALVVQAGGQRVKQLTTLHDEKMRRRILAAIGELIDFAGGYDALVHEGVAPPLTTSFPQPTPAQEGDEELTRQQAAFLDQLERELKANTVIEPLAAVTEGGDIQEHDEPLNRGVNLVAEIDQILQRYVASDERIAHRSIHLRQPPGGLLQIVVDGKVYEHPNEVEDQTVREALKNALKEWESR
jgi:hypothetical protein